MGRLKRKPFNPQEVQFSLHSYQPSPVITAPNLAIAIEVPCSLTLHYPCPCTSTLPIAATVRSARKTATCSCTPASRVIIKGDDMLKDHHFSERKMKQCGGSCFICFPRTGIPPITPVNISWTANVMLPSILATATAGLWHRETWFSTRVQSLLY